MNKRPSLDTFTGLVLRAAEEEDVAMTKGGGLGFSVTRIWPSTPFIRNEDPYMRVSVGVDPDEVEPVARAIYKGLERHYRNSRSAMSQWKLRENGVMNASGNGMVKANGNEPVAMNGNGAFKQNGNYFDAGRQ
jgi:cystathionine gamma-synthase